MIVTLDELRQLGREVVATRKKSDDLLNSYHSATEYEKALAAREDAQNRALEALIEWATQPEDAE